jgi:biotin carboxyl carrier protein
MHIRIPSIIGLLAIAICMTPGCKQTTGTSEESANVITPVTITPVIFKPVTSTIELPAVTSFLNKSIIRATTTGSIEKISVTQGEYVSDNQHLFTIRTREAMAMNNNGVKDTSLAFMGLINITSPKQGVISSISYQKGDFVQEGDELAVVSEQNSLVFILDIPFELDKFIEKNRKCEVSLPDNTQISCIITGKLSDMNMETQTIRYVLKPSAGVRLPGNLIGSVKLIRSTNNNAQVLPKKAVLADEAQTKFWVMKLINDTVAVKEYVIKGYENNEEVEITEPKFLPSDRILLTGNYGLSDTAKIAIIKE